MIELAQVPGWSDWRDLRSNEWQAVLKTTSALARSSTEEELLVSVCRAVVESGSAFLAVYWRPSSEIPGRFAIRASYGPVERLQKSHPEQAGGPNPNSPSGVCFTTGEIVYLPDAQHDANYPHDRDRAANANIKSLLAVPVRVYGVVNGVLTVYADEPLLFDEVASSLASTLCQELGLGLERLRNTAKLNDALEATIRALTSALEARDPYTAGHQAAVAVIAEQIAECLGLDAHEIQGIRLAALIHDIGKIGVPTELLLKPSLLRDPEMSLLQQHVIIGEEMLAGFDFPWPLKTAISQHHERLDGSGYPRGLHGDEISLAGRILAVADVADAMSRDRPYKPSIGQQATIEYLCSERGTLFDPAVVDCVVELARAGSLKS
ncbi:MAG: HD domain-containing phosphohydrolase [Actinomycetota bacterium]|nr:HD domain-containing phosphohydrolase [Actinomycetota bacterium]